MHEVRSYPWIGKIEFDWMQGYDVNSKRYRKLTFKVDKAIYFVVLTMYVYVVSLIAFYYHFL